MNQRFYRGNDIPAKATRDQIKVYRAYVDECKAERSAAMSFEEWVLAGELSLAGLRNKWHQEHVAEMKARFGDDWKPEVEVVDPGTGEIKTKRAKGPKGIRSANPASGSTKKVWVIADGVIADPSNDLLPDSKEFRAEVIKRSVAQGINKGTAQVQVGKWKKARTA